MVWPRTEDEGVGGGQELLAAEREGASPRDEASEDVEDGAQHIPRHRDRVGRHRLLHADAFVLCRVPRG